MARVTEASSTRRVQLNGKVLDSSGRVISWCQVLAQNTSLNIPFRRMGRGCLFRYSSGVKYVCLTLSILSLACCNLQESPHDGSESVCLLTDASSNQHDCGIGEADSPFDDCERIAFEMACLAGNVKYDYSRCCTDSDCTRVSMQYFRCTTDGGEIRVSICSNYVNKEEVDNYNSRSEEIEQAVCRDQLLDPLAGSCVNSSSCPDGVPRCIDFHCQRGEL